MDFHVWGNDHALPNQDLAAYSADEGDSGAPVYQRLGDGAVTLYGVHHGRTAFSGAAFSPMWLVRYDYPGMMKLPW